MAVYSFRLTPEAAWWLTIPELGFLMKQLNADEHRKNYRAAMFVAAIYNVNRDPKKKKNPYTPEEILGEPKQNPKDMLSMAKGLTELHGGEVRE